MPLAIMLGGARPVASDRALPTVGAHVASTCGNIHLAGSRPHASGRALPWLRPTVGCSVRAAAVNRPARPDSQNLERQAPRDVRGITSANRARIAAQCSSLNSISGSAASRFRNVCARCCTRHFSPNAILRSSAGAGRQW
jgi:hypothetical protein